MNAKPNIRQVVPFFGVDDMRKSLSFYVDGLGSRMTNSWTPRGTIEWCLLELGGTAIMLQEYRKGGENSRPAGKVGAGMQTVFICDDAIGLYKMFKANGLSPSVPFVGNSMWVTTVHDPDGYVLLFESETDVPEETVWKE